MSKHTPRVIELKEYERAEFETDEIPVVLGNTIFRRYSAQISIDFPSPKTDGKWLLIPRGWVGQIPLDREFTLRLYPKVKLVNVFRMLEYAYRLESFRVLDGLIDSDSLTDFYERLAAVLSLRVIARAKKGFYRAYLPRNEHLSFIRGRLDLNRAIRAPWKVKAPCHYQEHTADIDDNQILAWTLFLIGRTGLCAKLPGNVVSRAYHALQGSVSLAQHGPEACVNRRYHRLNDDYRPLHALCRFFLDHTGPTHDKGEKEMLPFLIDMARLYETFVGEWLRTHIPKEYKIKTQERVVLGSSLLSFRLDLVLYSTRTDRPLCVLDTKYKASGYPSNDDIYQVVTYAKLKGCQEAILIYPVPLEQPLVVKIGDVHVRSTAFRIDGCLDEAGKEFLDTIIAPDWCD